MTQDELSEQYKQRAIAERAAGSRVEIHWGLPYVSVSLAQGDEYFFQGEEAEQLLDEVPDWCNASDYILAQAQNW